MPTPSHSIIFWAPPVNASTLVNVGDVLIPSASGGWQVATSAARGNRRAEGVAISTTNGSGLGSVEIQQAGSLDATITGLGAGPVSLVRTSAAGRMERVSSYTVGDDVIGLAEESGRVHLLIGLPWQQLVDASVGETNTASNVGTTGTGTAGVFKQKTGVNLEMRRVVAGANVTVTEGASDITIAASASGEANTASNVGTTGAGTAGVFKQKTGVNLEMRRLVAGSNVTLTEGASDITIAASSGGSGFTAGGDLSGTSTNQTVVGVRATTVGTAGGAHVTGAVLRTTGTTSCDWGAVDLSSSNARTGTLPVANGGTGQTAVPGSDTSILVNNAGAYGAGSWSISGNGLSNANPAAAISVGNTPAQSGAIRLPYNSPGLRARHSSGARDVTLIEGYGSTINIGSSDIVNNVPTGMGAILSRAENSILFGAPSYTFYNGMNLSAPVLNIESTFARSAIPFVGHAGASSPYGVHGVVNVNPGTVATHTLQSTEYSYQVLIINVYGIGGSTTVVFPNPSNQLGAYTKDIILRPYNVDATQTIVLSCGSGTKTVSLSQNGFVRARCLFQPNEAIALSCVSASNALTMGNAYYQT